MFARDFSCNSLNAMYACAMALMVVVLRVPMTDDVSWCGCYQRMVSADVVAVLASLLTLSADCLISRCCRVGIVVDVVSGLRQLTLSSRCHRCSRCQRIASPSVVVVLVSLLTLSMVCVSVRCCRVVFVVDAGS